MDHNAGRLVDAKHVSVFVENARTRRVRLGFHHAPGGELRYQHADTVAGRRALRRAAGRNAVHGDAPAVYPGLHLRAACAVAIVKMTADHQIESAPVVAAVRANDLEMVVCVTQLLPRR